MVALRYDPERFLFHPKVIGGRSSCPHCRTKLGAHELIPFLSWLWQRGKCRSCSKRIAVRYLLVELSAGFLTLLTPFFALKVYSLTAYFPLLAGLWTAVFLLLLLITLIDLRLMLIPDEATIIILLLALAIIWFSPPPFALTTGSFFGSYAPLLGYSENAIANHAWGLLFSAGFFFLLYLLTRGRGMGFGDVKLAGALGILFGWPDILLLTMLAFVSGSVIGIYFWARGARLKKLLPFGPFLAFAAFLLFAYGPELVRVYFSLFGAW